MLSKQWHRLVSFSISFESLSLQLQADESEGRLDYFAFIYRGPVIPSSHSYNAQFLHKRGFVSGIVTEQPFALYEENISMELISLHI
jgi:hypothetical protein